MPSEITSEMNNWIVKINEKLSKMESIPKKETEYNPFRKSICRVDGTIREKFSESNYTPRIVSFGPHYYGHKSCEPTQRVKENVLLHFLKRSNKRLDDYIEAFLKQDLVRVLTGKYSGLDPKWQEDDDDFLRLMILDGCFLLEVAREADRLDSDFKSDNPVWSIDGLSIVELREHYIHDMLLLENQIPMRVLYVLCHVESNGFEFLGAMKQVNYNLLRLLSPFPCAEETLKWGKYHNVLDLYRNSLLFQDYKPWVRVKSMISCFSSHSFKTASTTKFRFNIPSAIELNKVGMEFTTNKTMTLMDISFSGRTLRLSQISIDGSTKSIFLNLIAFERLDRHAKGKSLLIFTS